MTEEYQQTSSKNCVLCGAVFFRLKDRSHRQWNEQRFCSDPCRHKTPARHSDPWKRLEDNFVPEPNSGCWLWIGTEMSDGYGHLKLNGRLIRAHRLSYELFKGPIPPELGVLHTCDVRLCVNPDHLVLGTHQENMRDMVTRGRSLKGEKHNQAKLTAQQVLEIRSAIGSKQDIANRYGITRQQVGHIKSGQQWRHL